MISPRTSQRPYIYNICNIDYIPIEREGGREGKGREGKGREGKGRRASRGNESPFVDLDLMITLRIISYKIHKCYIQ